MIKLSPFEQAIDYIPARVRRELARIPSTVKNEVQEVRIRIGRAPSICIKGREHEIGEFTSAQNIIIDSNDIDECFNYICEYSIHSYQKELAQSYITVKGGHRVGISASAVVKSGRVDTIKDISGLNIRIARQMLGSADSLMNQSLNSGPKGLLIVGPPTCGKTTILRDICRQLGGFYKLSIIDERGEIAAVYRGEPQNNIGRFSDVFDGYPKAIGILTAIRVMSPQVIVCDEIGNEEECRELMSSVNSGVHIIASAHAGTIDELYERKHIMKLISSGVFTEIILLDSGVNIGRIKSRVKVVSHNAKNNRSQLNNTSGNFNRDISFVRVEQESARN